MAEQTRLKAFTGLWLFLRIWVRALQLVLLLRATTAKPTMEKGTAVQSLSYHTLHQCPVGLGVRFVVRPLWGCRLGGWLYSRLFAFHKSKKL